MSLVLLLAVKYWQIDFRETEEFENSDENFQGGVQKVKFANCMPRNPAARSCLPSMILGGEEYLPLGILSSIQTFIHLSHGLGRMKTSEIQPRSLSLIGIIR